MPNRLNLNWARTRGPAADPKIARADATSAASSVARAQGRSTLLPSRREVVAVLAGTAVAAAAGGCVSGGGGGRGRGAGAAATSRRADLTDIAKLLSVGGVLVEAVGSRALRFREAPAPANEAPLPAPLWEIDTQLFDPDGRSDPELKGFVDRDPDPTRVRLTLGDAFYTGTRIAADAAFNFELADGAATLTSVELWRENESWVTLVPDGGAPLALLAWIKGDAAVGAVVSRWKSAVLGQGKELRINLAATRAPVRLWARQQRPPEEAAHVPWTAQQWVLEVGDSAGAGSAGTASDVSASAAVGATSGALGACPFTLIRVGVPQASQAIEEAERGISVESLMSDLAPRRSVVCVERGGHCWRVEPVLPKQDRVGGIPAAGLRDSQRGAYWDLQFANDKQVFDRLSVESAADAPYSSRRRAAKYWSVRRRDDSLARYFTGGCLIDGRPPDGPAAEPPPFALELRNLAYLIAFDDEGHHVAVLGDLLQRTQWASLVGCAVELGSDAARTPAPENTAAFEWVGLHERIAYFRCRALLHRIVPIVPGDMIVTQASYPRPQSLIELEYGEVKDSGPDQGRLRIYLPQRVRARGTNRATLAPAHAVLRLPMPPVTVERAADLLRLRFEFENLGLVATTRDAPRLFRNEVALQSYWKVVFPPQHIAEQTVDLADEPARPPGAGAPGPVAGPAQLNRAADATRTTFCRIAGETALVFLLRAGEKIIPFGTVQDYLDWNSPRLELSVQPAETLMAPDPPQWHHTAIEAPFKLVLAPLPQCGWAHSYDVIKAAGGRAELWHTRLAVRGPQGGVDPANANGRALRAVWSPDLLVPDVGAGGTGGMGGAGGATAPPADWDEVERYHSPLVRQDRRDIVHLTWRGQRLIEAEQLTLTALAASLALSYRGVPGSGFESWQHRATMGRDHYVRVVRAGVLYPYDFKAAYIRISERKFITAADGRRSVAYLTVRRFIEIRDPRATFANRNVFASEFLLLDAVSPNLREPDSPHMFWPTKLDGTSVQWRLAPLDKSANRHVTAQPLLFVANSIDDAGKLARRLEDVNQEYHQADEPTRTLRMGGARVAFAVDEAAAAAAPAGANGDGADGPPDAGEGSGAAPAPPEEMSRTSYETESIEIGAAVARSSGNVNFIKADILDVLAFVDPARLNAETPVWGALERFFREDAGVQGSAAQTAWNTSQTMLGTLWTRLDGDHRRFRVMLNDRRFADDVDVARENLAKLFDELAASEAFRAHLDKIAQQAGDDPNVRALRAIAAEVAAQTTAGSSPLMRTRRLIEAAFPDAVAQIDVLGSIFSSKLAAAELKNVRSTVAELGVQLDDVAEVVRAHVGRQSRQALDTFNGLDPGTIIEGLKTEIQALPRRLRFELFDALEREGIELPRTIKLLRSQPIADEALFFENLNRRLLEFWAGVRFKSYRLSALVLAEINERIQRGPEESHRLHGLVTAIWGGVLDVSSFPTDPLEWAEGYNTSLKAKLDALRRPEVSEAMKRARAWFRENIALPLLQQEVYGRLPIRIAGDLDKILQGVKNFDAQAWDSVAFIPGADGRIPDAQKILDYARANGIAVDVAGAVISFVEYAQANNIEIEVARAAMWNTWLNARTELEPARVAGVIGALARSGIAMPAPLRAVLDKLAAVGVDVDALPPEEQKKRLAELADEVEKQLLGAVAVDDFRPLIGKLVPAADELARFVNERISSETKALLGQAGRVAGEARDLAERLTSDLNNLLGDATLVQRSVRKLAAMLIEELRRELPAADVNAIELAWNQKAAQASDLVREFVGWFNGTVVGQTQNVSGELRAYVGHFRQVVEMAESATTAERIEKLNRLILRLRFPRSIPDVKSFLPVMRKAVVSNPAVAAMTGAVDRAKQKIEYAAQFVHHGFDKVHNAGEVFCKLTEDAAGAAANVEEVVGPLVKKLDELKGQLPDGSDVRREIDAAREALRGRADDIKGQVRQALRLDALERQVESAVGDAKARLDGAIAGAQEEFRGSVDAARKYIDDKVAGAARRVGGRIAASFPAENFSGLALPDMNVSGLSRKLGNVAGDLEQLAKEQLDPFKYFPAAKLLGKLDLKEVVKAAIGEATIPKFLTDIRYPTLPNLSDLKARIPETIESKLDWKPEVQELAFFKPLDDPRETLTLHASTKTTVRTGETTYAVDATMRRFAVVIGSFIEVQFASCRFYSASGSGSGCDPKIDQVVFRGALAFVDKMREKLGDLFGDGFRVDITPADVRVSLALAIPDLAFGAFSMQGLRLATGVSLPLRGGDPLAFYFRFADRANPFIISVGIFGGTGFFAIELQTGGNSPGSCVKRIEAALEFGGYLALNLGVAAGSVAVMGGIYYSWQSSAVSFSAYLRITGHLSILGLVSVTVEFFLALIYTRSGNGNYAEGTAQLRVRIKIGFFKKSVTLRVHRRIAGSGGSGSVNGAGGLPDLECTSLADLEAAAQKRFDGSRAQTVEDEMGAEHFRQYWGAFALGR